MRVSTGMLYAMNKTNLGRNASELQDATRIVSTGKRINLLSDDPVGLSHVIDLNSSIANIDQLKKNISTGRQWLDSGESTLRSSLNAVDEAKVLSISMNSGGKNDEDRKSAAQQIDGILKRMVDLGNTQVNGQFIFSGTKTDERPFVFDNETNPTQVQYKGNSDAFKVKVDNATDIEVGHVGQTVFERDLIDINDANNKIDFREDPAVGGFGGELTATIPSGSYTKAQLAEVMENALEKSSAGAGVPNVLNVSNSVTVPVNNASIVVDDSSKLPTGGVTGISATYDGTQWAIGGSTAISLTHLSTDEEVFMDFSGDGKADLRIKLDGKATAGYNVGFDLGTAAAGGNGIQYDVSFDDGTGKFRIQQEATTPANPLDNVNFLWKSGSNSGKSIGAEIGFDFDADKTIATPTATAYESDKKVEWSVFNSLVELKSYLEKGDTDGINRSIRRLTSDFNQISGVVSDSGIKGGRLDVRESVLSDLNISNKSNRKDIEEADIIEASSDLISKRTAYEAALSAASKVMKISLVDFL